MRSLIKYNEVVEEIKKLFEDNKRLNHWQLVWR